MAQTMRAQAVAAITDDGNFTGSSVYASVGGPSETAPDTGDYWNGNDNQTDVLELRMTDLSGSTPGSGTCTVSIYQTTCDTDSAPASGGSTPTYDIEVYEGTTQIASRAGISSTDSAFTLDNNLTFAASSITDWSNVRLRFTSNGTGGSPSGRRGVAVSYMEISTPDYAAEIDVNLATMTSTTHKATITQQPRVWLNTTATKTGADEMTVTSYNTAGTSITFSDPAGGKTGSLQLGVERPRDGAIDWIAVTVTASGTTVNAGVASMTTTAHKPSIDYDLRPAAASMTTSTHAATVALDVNVAANLATMTSTAHKPSIDYNLGPTTATLTSTTYAASIDYDLRPGVVSLTSTTYPVTLTYDVNVNANAGSLTSTTYSPSIDYDLKVNAASMTTSTHAATVTLPAGDTNVAVGLATLTSTVYSPSIDYDLRPGVASLTTTTYSPSIDYDLRPGAASMTSSTHAATVSVGVTIAAGTVALTSTTYKVNVDYDLRPTPATLTTSTHQATVSLDRNISANAGSLTSSTHQATLSFDVGVSAAVAAMTSATHQATLVYDVNVLAGVASMTTTTHQAAAGLATTYTEATTRSRRGWL